MPKKVDYLIRGLDPVVREDLRQRLKVHAAKHKVTTGELAAGIIIEALERADEIHARADELSATDAH